MVLLVSRLLFSQSTVMLLYISIAGVLMLGNTESANPIKDGFSHKEAVYIANNHFPKTTTSTKTVFSQTESHLTPEPLAKTTESELELRSEEKEYGDVRDLDYDFDGKTKLFEMPNSISSTNNEISGGLDVKSRWFPTDSYAENLKKFGLLAETIQSTISNEKMEFIERLNSLLPHTLRFKEEKHDIERIGENTPHKRTKRSWGDFWYDYEDYGLDYCDEPPCPAWSEWHGTGLCDASCGGGKRLLVRYCNNSKTDEFQGGCEGESTQLENCNTQPCPSWTKWTPSNQCSATCGKGIQKYTRNCMSRGQEAQGCTGENVEFRVCSNPACPAEWTNWSRWGQCSRTCGSNGVQFRRRLCIVAGRPRRGNKTPCKGYGAQQRRCAARKLCPPRFSNWTEWSQCDAITCDATGSQSRSRRCLGSNGEVLPKYRMNCRADQLIEERQCRTEPCAKACTIVVVDFGNKTAMYTTPKPTWSQWTAWSSCSVSCGLGGKQTRKRMCFGVLVDESTGEIILKEDKTCQGHFLGERDCHFNVGCPHWDSWQNWDACSKSCGFQGRRRRSRRCIADIYGRFNAGEKEESSKLLERTDISTKDHTEGSAEPEGSADNRDWENLPRITMFSGGSDLHRKKRKLIRTASLNDHWCEGGTNHSINIGSCNEQACPPRWGRWQAWSTCSVTCGRGQAQRSRRCIGEGICHGNKYEFKPCHQAPCWGEWSQYTPCTQSCGAGLRIRSRKCNGMSHEIQKFHDCKGPDTENITCNVEECPKWSEWSDWGNCSAPCDGGTKMRIRKCVQGDCNGRNNDIASCNFQPCPYWGEWSTFSCCSVSCGDGAKTRKRICRHGEPGVHGCEGDIVDTQHCNPSACNETVQPSINSFRCGLKPENKTSKTVLKIYNGQVSKDHEWPWQVSWQHHTCIAGKYDCTWEHLCGATLLGQKWVVTAGHCIQEWVYRVVHDDPGDKWSVVVGMTKLDKSGKRYFIRRVFLHPQYEYKGVPRNDIALLKLRDPVPITDFAMPACLPDQHVPGINDECFVTGWGNTDVGSPLSSLLRHAALPIVPFGECQKLGDLYKNYLNKNWHLCAGDITNKDAPDSCRGDSGGPMVCIRPDRKWYLAGITSFGFMECGTAGHAGIYVPMSNYENWVKDTIEKFSHNGC